VQGELLDLVNFVPAFEQAARCLMPEIMEMEVLNAEILTGPVKRLFVTDEQILREEGVVDFSRYNIRPGQELELDISLRSDALRRKGHSNCARTCRCLAEFDLEHLEWEMKRWKRPVKAGPGGGT
jgi:hypothetical protein